MLRHLLSTGEKQTDALAYALTRTHTHAQIHTHAQTYTQTYTRVDCNLTNLQNTVLITAHTATCFL